ncbi:unnamed protein product, partial [Anisakis simplex]|uniref:Fucose-1-phosphate guanylyltransferase (inferred by orthology to a human protein) n=1 Tax=Anisakis simplex TaxID=6269 RepID=A0A0M3KHF2_ANISI
MTMKWDAVVLTACDLNQKEAFENQLADLSDQLNQFAERFFVFEDQPSNIRIGSGGATQLALDRLNSELTESKFIQSRIVIIHSGGLSQRMPSASALGKVFL